MPVPTDTFWNIKRLNRVFAISALLLVGVTGWAILQDYNKDWRGPQRSAIVWDAAMTDEKIHRSLTPEQEEQVKKLDAEIANLDAQLQSKDPQYQQILAEMAAIDKKRQNLEFDYNTRKAVVSVDEGHLQNAIVEGNQKEIDELKSGLLGPEAILAQQGEQLAAYKRQLAEDKTKLAEEMARFTSQMNAEDANHPDLAALKKQRATLSDAVDALRKKRDALAPTSIITKVGVFARDVPLGDFMNPKFRPRQILLPQVHTDVAFMKIQTVDRCTTCHVNADKKDFTEAKVLAYLEEQVATVHKYNLELPAKAGEKPVTLANPGGIAVPVDFWHNWGQKFGPTMTAAVMDKVGGRISSIAGTIGKGVTVTFDSQPVTSFSFDPAATDPAIVAKQNAIIVELMKAWYLYTGPGEQAFSSESDHVKVTIDPADKSFKATTAASARAAAMAYPDAIRGILSAKLPADEYKMLQARYRFALVNTLNPYRKQTGYAELDPSPVLLAHPRLDLYVDMDSKHPSDSSDANKAMGCTSCHDGSGQETNFVLAAHSARAIWVDDVTGEPVLPEQLAAKASDEPKKLPDLSSMLSAVYPPGDIVPTRLASLAMKLDSEAGNVESASATSAAPAAPPEPDENAKPTNYVDPTTGHHGTAVPQAKYWAKKYEPSSGTTFEEVYHLWDWPMRTPQYIQANCVRCHTSLYDIKQEAPVVYEGHKLFATLGCVNCHQMDSIPSYEQRKVGPDLLHVDAKLSRAFVNTWVWATKAFRPSTKMPHFFMLENNSSDEEIRRTRQEVRSITEYLFRTAEPLETKYPLPTDVSGDKDRGRQLFLGIWNQADDSGNGNKAGVGCVACHTNLNETAHKWIITDLTKRDGLPADEAEDKYLRMTYNERQMYCVHNLEQSAAADVIPTYEDGTPQPIFQHHGPELSGVGTKLLSGRTPEQARAWLFQWLKEPAHYSPTTVMPRLRLSDQEAMDLVEYLLDQTRDKQDKDLGDHYQEQITKAQKAIVTANKSIATLNAAAKPDAKKVAAQNKRIKSAETDIAAAQSKLKVLDSKGPDEWAAGETAPDAAKLRELTSMFLRSRFPAQTAYDKADDDALLTDLATDALTNAPLSPAQVKELSASVAKMDKPTRQMIFLGKKLIAHYGCMQCHTVAGGEKMTSPCANLSDWGQKSPDKLAFGYLDPHEVEEMRQTAPTTAIWMVNGLSVQAANLVHTLPQGGWTKPISTLVNAAWPDVEHTRNTWLIQKLNNTRVWDRGQVLLEPEQRLGKDGEIDPAKDADPTKFGKPYDKIKMPTFYLSEEQVHALVTFVISNRDRLIGDKMTAAAMNPAAVRIARGRAITELYNCVGCHQIEGNYPAVQQYFAGPDSSTTLTNLSTFAPPSLRGEGNKVNFEWLYNFFKNVEPLRPLPKIRMPSFPFREEPEHAEIDSVIGYFSATSNKEARELKSDIDLITKYIDVKKAAATAVASAGTVAPPAAAPAGGMNPGDDWWQQPTLANAANNLRTWALGHHQMVEIVFAGDDPATLTKAYNDTLFKARFTADLYNAPYPFVDAPRPQPDEQRFKTGEDFVHAMGCLNCHVMGDPNAPGAVKEPKAPNLDLAYRRLQQRWVAHWVQEPPVIQVGTNMPAFMTGLPVYQLDGQTWQAAQSLPDPARKDADQQYGATPQDEKGLLLDFIWSAGLRNYTSVQPLPPAAKATTQPSN